MRPSRYESLPGGPHGFKRLCFMGFAAALPASIASCYAVVPVRRQAGLQCLRDILILITGDAGVLRRVLAQALVGKEERHVYHSAPQIHPGRIH